MYIKLLQAVKQALMNFHSFKLEVFFSNGSGFLILKSFLLGNKTEAFENDKEVSDSEKVSDPTDQNYHSDNADDPANEEPELICPRRHTWSHSGSDRKDSFLDQEMFKYL